MQAPAPYTLRVIEELLGLKRGTVARFVAAGFVTPERGPRNEYRFGFRDMVLLRTAQALTSARIPRRRLLASLRALRAALPQELPLSGLRIQAVGADVVVLEGDALWQATSGQRLLDFEVRSDDGRVLFLPAPAPEPAPAPAPATAPDPAPDSAPDSAADSAAGWFQHGAALDATDAAAAEAAYRRALQHDPEHVDSLLNLGALLCEAGRCDEAVALLDDACRRCPREPALLFNLAIALEDRQRPDDALQRYRQCLALDPGFADAHFNAARLHQQRGEAQAALRHYSAYRRLLKGAPAPERE